MREFTVRPDPDDPRLTRRVSGIDQEGRAVDTAVVVERPLTLFLNGQEIVTMMTIGDHPDCLAVGYLLNQNMLRADDVITAIDYDDDLETVVVRTERRTDFEKKLRKKTLTSGCAQGTVFGDLMEKFDEIRLPAARSSGPPGSTPSRARSIRRPAFISPPAPSMAVSSARRTGRFSIWRMSAATTRSTRSRATCISTGGARWQDLLHHRPAHLGDGDQDRADADPDPRLAFGFYRLGRRARAPRRAHAHRPRQGPPLPRALGRRPHRL